VTWVAGSVLLCGEQPELGGGPLSRLTRIMGFDDKACPVRFKCVTLASSGRWTKKVARKRAVEILTHEECLLIVLLGRKAAAAFGHEGPSFTRLLDPTRGRVSLVSLPPPSSREWRPQLVHRARELLREAVPSLPWGVFDDSLARLAFACRLAAEGALWAAAVPADLRNKLRWRWDEADLMVALDALEERGLPRTSGALLVSRFGATA
jgi:hypothetical protein